MNEKLVAKAMKQKFKEKQVKELWNDQADERKKKETV